MAEELKELKVKISEQCITKLKIMGLEKGIKYTDAAREILEKVLKGKKGTKEEELGEVG